MKTNKEIIGAIAGEFTKIGQSTEAIAIYLTQLAESDAIPAIEEVLPKVGKADKKAPAKEEVVEETEEVVGNVIETEDGEVNLDELSVKELKKFAKDYEVEIPAGKPKKAEIIEAILEALLGEEEVDEEEDEEEAEVESVDEDVDGDDEEEEEADEEEEDEELEVDLEEMDADELKSFIEENELGDAPKKKKGEKKSAYADRLREFIEEALAVEDEEEEEEVDEDVEDEEEEEELDTEIETDDGIVDLADLSAKELKKFAKDYEIELTAKKKDEMILEILEAINGDDEEEADEVEEDEEDGEELADEYGLNDMDVKELAEILEEAGLSVKGKKQALVDRVLRGIEDGTIDVEGE